MMMVVIRKNTKLKEFYFVRFADDFKIVCKSYQDAVKLKIAVTDFLKEGLGLEVGEEKTKIVNLKKDYSKFLGLKIKARKKKIETKLEVNTDDIKKSQKHEKTTKRKLKLYNSVIIGIHNYYNMATEIAHDMSIIGRSIYFKLKKFFK